MKLEMLNRIPGLRDVDFSRPAARRNLALGLFGGALVILVVALRLAGAGHGAATPEDGPAEGRTKPFTMTVPEGDDRDRNVLGAKSMIAARETGRRGNRDLYNAAADDAEDPYATMQKGRKPAADTAQGRSVREMAQEAFGVAPHTTPATAAQEAPPEEEKPRTVKVRGGAPRAQAESPAQERQTEEAREEAPEAEPVRLRRTGGVSSLNDDWGTVEGIGSLETGDEYVVQDDDKPYKVMFLRDQKIKSGDRVALRLLEDMAAGGVLIPRNTHLSAVCQVGERLQVTVSSIEIGGKIYSLDYVAFDNDGGEGLYCPSSNAGRKADQASQSLGQTAISAVTGLVTATAGSTAGNVARIGAQAVRGTGGSATATISSGYTFYLLKR